MTPAETVDAFLAAINARDVDGAVALVSEDCEYDNVPIGKNHGPAGIRAVLDPIVGACSEIDWIVHRQSAEGNVVFNERLDRFHMPFGWIEVPVTGVFEIDADGRISLWRDYFDLATYTNQLPSS